MQYFASSKRSIVSLLDEVEPSSPKRGRFSADDWETVRVYQWPAVVPVSPPLPPQPAPAANDLAGFLRTIAGRHTGLEGNDYLESEAIAAFWLATANEFKVPECYFLDSMVIPSLMQGDEVVMDEEFVLTIVQDDYQNRCLPHINALTARTEYILMPVNVNQEHWVLVEIQCRTGKCLLYNSLDDRTVTGKTVLKHLQPWITALCIVANIAPITLKECKRAPHRLTQNDLTSCGVATCMNMYHRASRIRHRSSMSIPSVTLAVDQIRKFRDRLARAIASAAEFTASSICKI